MTESDSDMLLDLMSKKSVPGPWRSNVPQDGTQSPAEVNELHSNHMFIIVSCRRRFPPQEKKSLQKKRPKKRNLNVIFKPSENGISQKRNLSGFLIDGFRKCWFPCIFVDATDSWFTRVIGR